MWWFRNANRVKVWNKVNTKLYDQLRAIALGDASFSPRAAVNIFLQNTHEPLEGEHGV